VNRIKRSYELYFHADKTSNIYKVKVEDYKKLIGENVSTVYLKIDEKLMNEITACKSNLQDCT